MLTAGADVGVEMQLSNPVLFSWGSAERLTQAPRRRREDMGAHDLAMTDFYRMDDPGQA